MVKVGLGWVYSGAVSSGHAAEWSWKAVEAIDRSEGGMGWAGCLAVQHATLADGRLRLCLGDALGGAAATNAWLGMHASHAGLLGRFGDHGVHSVHSFLQLLPNGLQGGQGKQGGCVSA